jgi:hypothetical protein
MSNANTRVLYDADRKGTRRCGECTLCCKLLPVRELDKKANERCKHQRHGQGCTVYQKPAMPMACVYWSCRWLLEQDTKDLRRPDRSHYVIDVMPDYVTVVDNTTGAQTNIEVVQIWCDPDYPDAHRDPALREYLMRRAREGVAALVRFSSQKALHLMAPPLTEDRQWHEIEGAHMRPTHSLVDTMKALDYTARKQG